MRVSFKDGSIREMLFDPKLAVKLMGLGHKVDHSPGISSAQREYERREIQKEYDAAWLAERTNGYTVS